MVNSQTEEKSGRKLFYGLFIFPLIIAVGMAVLLCTVVLLTKESETPESLISSIKTGAPSKRWQKAFELSNELNQGRGLIRESGVMKEVIHILNDSEEYDPKTRSYMAMALARFDAPEAVVALREALGKEKNSEVQLYLLWALGKRQDKTAVALIGPYTQKEDESLRKMAAFVLGSLGNPEGKPWLVDLLGDPSRDVRWNAALSLARLGSDAGLNEIIKMLDRDTLIAYHQISEAKAEEIMINAIRGVALLNRPEVIPHLEKLSESDSSLKVRQAAIEALDLKDQANLA